MGDDQFDDFDEIADEDLLSALDAATTSRLPDRVPTRNPPTETRTSVNHLGNSLSTSRNTGKLPLSRTSSAPGARPASLSQQNSFRQTTLFGQAVPQESLPDTQQLSGRPYRGDTVGEPPTHHELVHDELKKWVYPTNLGPIRDYQFGIAKSSLFSNTLVALPTGLGKTFIAATVILNFFRWTKKGKIIFVAPTKPLASQQVDACLQVAGVSRKHATLLTGETPPVLREDEWATKRLFFMTPQTLINDLSKGYADPKSIVLLVVDEAHRATGDYAYVKVVEFIRRFSQSFRVLALTATPGSSVEAVQMVIDNLGISHVEIRTEDSIDIRQYVHTRNTDTVILEPSDDMLRVRELFSKALQPLVDKLASMNCYYNRDPMSLTQYGLLKAQQEWAKGPARHQNEGVKGMMRSIFTTLMSVAHGIKLLNFHGIKPFYEAVREFRNAEEEKGGKGSKYRRQILADESFQDMMITIEKWVRLEGFMGHPKLTYLCDTLLNHFLDAGEGSSTRAIVFSEYRDSAEDIVRLLNTHKPLISAAVFVGQADSKRSQGMSQKQQIEAIEKFKAGAFNVLVATSIGEEGLDIGQVDLIVCYDASSSPIRMLQRMGRTGRKRAGKVVLLLLKGKEEEAFAKAQDNYSKMQAMICEGSRFQFRHDLSTRILPREIRPEVDKRHVDIPIENTQDTSLPEPKKSAARLKKKPAKKVFHMPDGVETGFVSAAGSVFRRSAKTKVSRDVGPTEMDFICRLPELSSVSLDSSQRARLDRLYREYPSRDSRVEDIEAPRLNACPVAQRQLRPTASVSHGKYTKRCVKLFRKLGRSSEPADRYTYTYGEAGNTGWRSTYVPPLAVDSEDPTDQVVTDSEGDFLCSPRLLQTSTASNSRHSRVQVNKTRAVQSDDTKAGISATRDPSRGRQPRAKPRRGKSSFKGRGDQLEELGDDCMRTSDMEDSVDSDSGADLEDFVVGDDFSSSLLRSHDPRSLDPSATQDSDDDLPDLDTFLGRSKSRAPLKRSLESVAVSKDNSDRSVEEDEEDGDSVARSRPQHHSKRRRVVSDSDDDDDYE